MKFDYACCNAYTAFDHACCNAYTRYSIMHDIMHMRNSVMHAITHTRNSIMHNIMHMRIKLYMLQEQHCNYYTCYKSNILSFCRAAGGAAVGENRVPIPLSEPGLCHPLSCVWQEPFPFGDRKRYHPPNFDAQHTYTHICTCTPRGYCTYSMHKNCNVVHIACIFFSYMQYMYFVYVL